jgi:TRAP-type C4-dicarboxylate transport system substrate-binding protein
METMSDGRFTLNIAPAGEVGTTREIAEQIQNGTTEMGALVGAHLAPFYPDFNVYAGAYMFQDVDLGLAVMDGEFGDTLRQGFLEETGARIFGWLDTGGFQSFSNNVRPLESLEDFEGLSIRTMAMESHQELCRLLGMSPEPLDFGQLYESLDQGVIDGQKNAVETVILISMYEGQDYMTFDEHQLSMVWLHCNNDWYENLHPAYQQMLDQAGYRASVEGRQITRFYRRYGRDFIARNGVEVHYPSDDMIDNLRNEVQEPLNDTIRNDLLDTPELMDQLQDAIAQKREELAYDRFS